MKHVTAGFLILLATVPAHGAPKKSATAQWEDVRALPGGTEVRVDLMNGRWRFVVPSRRFSGQLQSVTDDSLVLTEKSAQRTLARPQIAQVSLKEKGHRWRNAGSGALQGAAIGACCGVAGVFVAPAGAVVGVAVGASRSTGWRTVYRAR